MKHIFLKRLYDIKPTEIEFILPPEKSDINDYEFGVLCKYFGDNEMKIKTEPIINLVNVRIDR